MPNIIQCKTDDEKNPFQIDTIELSYKNNDYYLCLKLKDEEKAADLLSYFCVTMAVNIKNVLHFSIVRHDQNKKNPMVIKGNIAQALFLLINEEILPDNAVSVLQDPEEDEIKTLLDNSKESKLYTAKVNGISINEYNLFKEKFSEVQHNSDEQETTKLLKENIVSAIKSNCLIS